MDVEIYRIEKGDIMTEVKVRVKTLLLKPEPF